MARVYVTAELADTIKSIRLANKLPSKELAIHIGKSPAYVTKLEKGEILTVSEDELKSILSFITQESSSFENIVEKVYTTLKYKYSDEEIEEQVWFANYDTVGRKVPIPNSLITEINEKLSMLKITREYLLSRINANESLPDEDLQNKNIPFNEWYVPDGKVKGTQSIKIKIDIERLNKILDSQSDRTRYILVLCIVFYLLKIEEYGERKSITDDENKSLMQKATDFLNKHKFYSLVSKNILLSSATSKEEQLQLLSTFDRENIDVVNMILTKIRFSSESDVKLANNYLTGFNNNLEWDLGFTLKLMGLHFNALGNLSHTKKKQLLEEIELLVSKYEDLPPEQKSIEHY